MSNDYVLRPYQKGDEEAIGRLLQIAYNHWPKADLNCSPLDHWVWKYLDAPSGIKIISVVLHGGEIVGVSSQMAQEMRLGDKRTLCGYAGDHAIHPEHQGKGLSGKVVQHAAQERIKLGVKYVYFVTRNKKLIESYNRSRHRFSVPILNMARILDVDKQLEAMPMERPWVVKAGFRALQLGSKMGSFIKPLRIRKELEIMQVAGFDGQVDELLEKNRGYRFIINGGSSYLNWRYCDPRAGSFKVYQAREDGELAGYIVTRVNRYLKDYPIGYIMDLLTLPGRNDVSSALLQHALESLDGEGANITTCMVPKGHPHENVYRSHGFLNSRINLHLYTNLNEVKQEHLVDDCKPGEIHFTYGAIDSLPIGLPNQ